MHPDFESNLIAHQGQLVMKAEKAVAYPASSVRFSFLLLFLFLFWGFLELL